LAAELGFPLMPWQAYVHDVANEVDPDTGWWAYDEVVITVERQAGKTTLKIPLYAHRMQLVPRGELWMTAQNGKKAVKRWENATNAMLAIPELNPHLKRWVTVARERMQWTPTGALLVPFAPDDENMHGESPDLVDVDEWWAFDAVAAEGLIASYSPGFLTKNAQAWKTSTMGTEASAGLNADVKKGRAAVEMDRRTGIAYFEWSLEDEPFGIPIDELTDEQLVKACIEIHPAIGFHPKAPAEKMRHHIGGELKTLGRREFIRAYGNRLQSSTGGWNVVSQPQWIAAVSPRAIPPTGRVGFGFEADPDGRDAAIAVAWRAPDGSAIGEVIKVQDGVTWLPDSVAALVKRWTFNGVVPQAAVQNSGPARQAADAVIMGGIDVLRMSQMDFSAACAQVYGELTARGGAKLRHIGQAPLNTAMEHVGKRRTGPSGAWAWRVDPDVSITALVAFTAAVWAVDHPRETEPDLGRFRIR
jgi:hypothetical protein